VRTILVIDDDPELRAVLSLVLSTSGFRVMTAADGEEGLQRMAADLPGLVLCDLDMPSVDGIAVASAMERDPRLNAVPLVIMSALSMERAAPVTSAVAMLAKPFLSKTLLALVHRFMAADRASSTEEPARGSGRMVGEPSY
jgi:chemosensory pili system protein ChpA (sensor histidine kinase/response regulator)